MCWNFISSLKYLKKYIFSQFSRRKKLYEPVKHSQVMIYLFFAHSKVETVFEWIKCVKKCQRKVMAAAAAVHYSILRSLTHSLRSATDIHGGKKSGLHNTQFRPENNYAKIFRDINSFEILYFRLVAVYQHFFSAILFLSIFYSLFMLMYHISDSSKSAIHGKKISFTHIMRLILWKEFKFSLSLTLFMWAFFFFDSIAMAWQATNGKKHSVRRNRLS